MCVCVLQRFSFSRELTAQLSKSDLVLLPVLSLTIMLRKKRSHGKKAISIVDVVKSSSSISHQSSFLIAITIIITSIFLLFPELFLEQ